MTIPDRAEYPPQQVDVSYQQAVPAALCQLDRSWGESSAFDSPSSKQNAISEIVSRAMRFVPHRILRGLATAHRSIQATMVGDIGGISATRGGSGPKAAEGEAYGLEGWLPDAVIFLEGLEQQPVPAILKPVDFQGARIGIH
jgi:hypothetical protein